jgi:hypothetical protein
MHLLVYLLEYMKMDGPGNIEYVNAKQAKEIYTYNHKLHLLVYLLEYMKMHEPGNIKLVMRLSE